MAWLVTDNTKKKHFFIMEIILSSNFSEYWIGVKEFGHPDFYLYSFLLVSSFISGIPNELFLISTIKYSFMSVYIVPKENILSILLVIYIFSTLSRRSNYVDLTRLILMMLLNIHRTIFLFV